MSSSGSFTLGSVSSMAGLRDDSRYVQITAPVQAGNSGGPLFDYDGNTIGIVSAKLNGCGLGEAAAFVARRRLPVVRRHRGTATIADSCRSRPSDSEILPHYALAPRFTGCGFRANSQLR